MKHVFFSDLARSDLDEIWDYIAQDNVDAADRVIDDLMATIGKLLSMPHSGRARPELAPRIRSFPCGRYIVFYRPEEECIAIARVLHGSRDLASLPYPDAGE